MGKKVNNSLTNVKEKRNPRKKRVDEDAMELNKLLKEKGVGILGGTKKSDGSYDFYQDKGYEKVERKTGGLINGRPTGKGKGAARSV